ncbi:Hpt domain-containing protein [Oleidesulfovibrio alaskensis]|uniref:Hpt domain-containing protein n=1 Tax=Oleidesulfovibrio alaskensis TaxID=58180 RepID=UPI00041C065D|nr:Hpt domain-containing protein [Oleidesulfovibrio alaskensis]
MSCIDYPRLRNKFGNEDTVRKILTIFMSDFDERLLRMSTMYSRDSRTELYRSAHALKGVAGTIYATGLQHCAASLEQAAMTQGAAESLLQKAWENLETEACCLRHEVSLFLS